MQTKKIYSLLLEKGQFDWHSTFQQQKYGRSHCCENITFHLDVYTEQYYFFKLRWNKNVYIQIKVERGSLMKYIKEKKE